MIEHSNIPWLAGIIDGEGYVGIDKAGSSYSPAIQICMTHQSTIDTIRATLGDHDVELGSRKPTIKESDKQKVMFWCKVTGAKKILSTCDLVLPYSVTKVEQLKLLREFVSSRIESAGLNASGKVRPNRTPYNDREHEIFRELKRLNRRGPSFHPIDDILWLEPSVLHSNLYNPNVVATPELKLLEHNLLTLGWMQPILITPEFEIIDGFHRWMLSKESRAIQAECGTRIPCVVLRIDPAEAMMATIRSNRAKGTHVAVRMSDIVRSLHHDHGLSEQQIMKGCGMNKDEVKLLLAGSLLKTRNLENYKYSKAWIPYESKRAQKQEFERGEEDGLES